MAAVALLLAAAWAVLPAMPAGAAGQAPAAPFASHPLNQPVVAMTASPSGGGYWLVARDGGVFSYGDARFHGSTGALALKAPIVGMASTPSGGGYWLVASDGGIFSFGDARFFGSTGALALKAPIVGMALTLSGGGYWLVASDGGIFSFGDARFFGSTGGLRLDAPVVGMARAAGGAVYWLVASDGGIFSFGDAPFHGSMGGKRLDRPIVGMTTTPGGHGYRFVATDGGVFNFGDARFHGSLGGTGHPLVVSMASTASGNGYWMLTLAAEVVGYGDAVYQGQPGPAFSATIAPLSAARKAAMVGVTWRPGCPLGLDSLRIITMPHWRFDGRADAGELVTSASAADAMVAAFNRIWDAKEPIDKMEPVERYGGSDDAADAANDTSSYNCRTTSTGTQSNHALGLAVDVNPLQNPYLHADGTTLDPDAQRYANRALQEPGVIHTGDPVWSAFVSVGWRWGGTVISPPDYQHFSPTGR